MFAWRDNYASAGGSIDPYWYNVSFLQNFEQTPTAYTDNSGNNNIVIGIGNAKPTAPSPFSGYQGSMYFDGSGDGLLTTNTTNTLVNTDFTWECWVNFGSLAGNPCLLGVTQDGTNRTLLYFDSTNGIRYVVARGSDQVSIQQGSTTGWSTNTWYHVAVVRSGNDYTIYRNGTSVATGTNSYAQSSLAYGFTLGFSNISTSYLYLNGFISNARVVNGTAVYTSNFTPSTVPLTAISGTYLLVNSSNQGLQRNGLFVDNSSNNVSLTGANNPSITYDSPFGNNYPGSTRFIPGSSQYVGAASSSLFSYGTGDFTIEFWFKTSAKTRQYPTLYSNGIFTNNSINLYDRHNNFPNNISLYCYNYSSSNTLLRSTSTISNNTWYHLAITRSGNTFRLFINGTQESTATSSFNIDNSINKPAYIAGDVTNASGFYDGNISNFRIVKGTAIYTSNFTVPTTPLTAVSGTSLLAPLTGAFYDISKNKNNITNVTPTASGSTALALSNPNIKKWQTQSGLYNSNGYETVLDSTNLQLGGGNFTIEGWLYRNASGVLHSLICKGASTTGWLLQVNASNQLIWTSGSSVLKTSTDTIGANTWTHVVITRSGSTGYMFVNGTLQGSTFTDSTIYNQTNNMFIGCDRSNANGLNGYLDDIRITKNTCRYVDSFTAPTKPFPIIGPIVDPTPAPPIVTSGIILYMDAGNTSSYPGTGTTWYDLSGNSYNGTLVNGPTYSSSDSGSLVFDGTNDYSNFGNLSAFNFGTSDFSISFWMNPNGWGTNYGVIDKKTSDATNGWTIYRDGTYPTKINMRMGTSEGFFLSTTNVTSGVWQNWTFVRSGSNKYWYLNGYLDATGSTTANLTDSASLQIARAQTWNGYYNGNISFVGIYNRALTSTEALQNYNAIRGRYGL